jgi:hypothetical protein
LAQELIRHQIPFERRENCFVDIADVPRAQELMDQQQRTNWTAADRAVFRSVAKSNEMRALRIVCGRVVPPVSTVRCEKRADVRGFC